MQNNPVADLCGHVACVTGTCSDTPTHCYVQLAKPEVTL
jgi:hypothetical protein